MKKVMIVFLLFLMINQKEIKAQQYNSVYFGMNVDLYYKIGKHAFRNNFPGIKAFVGFNSSNTILLDGNINGSFNLGSSITIYNKSLGNSLNIDFQDNQIDWTTNVSFGGLWGADTQVKYLQSINNVGFYNLQHRSKNAIHLGVNFIMNNYGRHQTNGSFSLTADKFSMTYYNDGGPFFADLGLGDSFDRYWTGGLMFYWHENVEKDIDQPISFNRLEFTFDQFTGYKAQMFEVLRIIGVNIQDYDIYSYTPSKSDTTMTFSIQPDDRLGYDYNASRYSLRYNFNAVYGVNVGVIGSLRDNEHEVYYAIQDIIHSLKRDPIHPNRNSNRVFVGFNFNSQLWKQEK